MGLLIIFTWLPAGLVELLLLVLVEGVVAVEVLQEQNDTINKNSSAADIILDFIVPDVLY